MTFSVAMPKEADETTWQPAKRIAEIKGESLGRVIQGFLESYVRQNQDLLKSVERRVSKQRGTK